MNLTFEQVRLLDGVQYIWFYLWKNISNLFGVFSWKKSLHYRKHCTVFAVHHLL